MSGRRKLIRGTSVQMDEEEEDDLQDGQAESAALPKMRAKRRRETKSKEMSEEEMMDLALRLSEQEASATELQQQEEEEAMMKAIQQSMFDQTQPLQTAFSSGSPHLLSRRKLSFPNGEKLFRGSPAGPDSGCSPEPFSEKTEEIRKKRLKKSGSHLPEMPDLSQTERTDSEASADSCNPLPAPLDSPQSSDSTRIDESEPQKSPVFPLTGCRAVVHVDRLSEEVVDSCRHSGFVSSSQDTWSWTQKSTWTRSPTFPQSNPKSPVSPTAGPELVSSSQESPTPPLSCRSPVFLRSPSEILSTAASQQRSPPHMQTPGRDVQNCRQLPAVAEEQRDASCSSTHTPPGSNMMLVWSDEDDVTLLRSPSPVFPKERHLYGAEAPAASMDNAAPNHSSSDQHSSSIYPSAPACRKEPATSTEEVLRPACRATPGGQTVHYFWGIPFCPRGLDPDAYTQVIEAQMEVYEKSLKQAQRRLLRKAEWAEPILPEPEKASSPETAAGSPRLRASQRPGLMLRGGRTTEEHPDQEEEEQHQEEEQMDADVCPETQLSGEDGAGGRSLPTEPPFPGCPDPPEVQVILQDDHSDGSAQTVDRGPVSPGGVEVKDPGDPSSEAAEVPGSPPTSVDCPICQLSFPASDIEMHAAFCNGGVAEDGTSLPGFQESPKPRRQRARRAEAAETSQPSDACRILEKCFICQSAIPLREYSRHTELCIRPRRSKPAAKGNLLSALQDTESRSADLQASVSKVQPDDVIDLRNDDDADALRVTDPPIRTFTPISELTDCLVDFKKQNRAKKPSQRRR